MEHTLGRNVHPNRERRLLPAMAVVALGIIVCRVGWLDHGLRLAGCMLKT